MAKQYFFKRRIGFVLIIAVSICVCPLAGRVFAQTVTDFDLDNAEPVELRSKIMEIHPEKAMLVVGEKEILIVDFVIGADLFQTSLRDTAGEAIPLDSFSSGQKVLVQGIKLPDGRIIASVIQQINNSRQQPSEIRARKRATVKKVREVKPVR